FFPFKVQISQSCSAVLTCLKQVAALCMASSANEWMKRGGSLSHNRTYQRREIPRIPRVELPQPTRFGPPPPPRAKFSLRVNHQYPARFSPLGNRLHASMCLHF